MCREQRVLTVACLAGTSTHQALTVFYMYVVYLNCSCSVAWSLPPCTSVGLLSCECFLLCSGKRSEGYALRGSSRKLNAGDGTETSSAQNLISMSNLETDEQREQLGALGVGVGDGGWGR